MYENHSNKSELVYVNFILMLCKTSLFLIFYLHLRHLNLEVINTCKRLSLSFIGNLNNFHNHKDNISRFRTMLTHSSSCLRTSLNKAFIVLATGFIATLSTLINTLSLLIATYRYLSTLYRYLSLPNMKCRPIEN